VVFIRAKRVGGNTYYQLVKNERVDGKHRQRVLIHLGHHATVGAAMDDWAKQARMDRQLVNHIRKRDGDDSLVAQRYDAKAKILEEKIARLQELREQGKV
jgi:hypothetical protein